MVREIIEKCSLVTYFFNLLFVSLYLSSFSFELSLKFHSAFPASSSKRKWGRRGIWQVAKVKAEERCMQDNILTFTFRTVLLSFLLLLFIYKWLLLQI